MEVKDLRANIHEPKGDDRNQGSHGQITRVRAKGLLNLSDQILTDDPNDDEMKYYCEYQVHFGNEIEITCLSRIR